MITHPLFDTPIEFTECKINILVVEQPNILVRLIQDLLLQKENCDGEFVLRKTLNPYLYLKI